MNINMADIETSNLFGVTSFPSYRNVKQLTDDLVNN